MSRLLRSLLVLSLVLVSFAVLAAPRPSPAAAGTTQTFIVLYKASAIPNDTSARIGKAGGTVVTRYPEIGVLIVRSNRSTFASTMGKDTRIEGVAATAAFAVRLTDDQGTGDASGALPGDAPAAGADPLSPLQWDMTQIHVPEAHAITGGSPAIVVGNIDTGLDWQHPDLAPNIDFANSVSCESGAPNTEPAAWDDHIGHGTHTAGTIAAAANGLGIVGVAPNVKIAGIKASNDDGFFFPEMVICAFMWAGSHHLAVTNNSYFADPYLFNCRNDPTQRAIWKAEQRAIRYAMAQGVTVVASAGNESDDMAHPEVDLISPDFPGSEQEREITNACLKVPVEIPGVIGVSAAGNAEQVDADPGADYLKSFYSSYGHGVVEVVAPGGDSVFFVPSSQVPNGRVLSTYPAENLCTRRVVDQGATYCYLQGTSMASPHVAGVAALVISHLGMRSPGQVAARLMATADAQPCPDALPAGYETFTRPSGSPQTCEGELGATSWYGAGQVNALTAITTGN